MKVGTEDKKKTLAAAALCGVALITAYVQFFSGAPVIGGGVAPTASSARPVAGGLPARAQPARRLPTAAPRRRVQGGGQAFQPVWERSQENENFNPLVTDPTLRTDLLAAVRAVEFTNVTRNIFEFRSRQRVDPGPTAAETARAAELQRLAERPPAPVQVRPAEPTTPRAPRLTWRYYGYANRDDDGAKRAFLLDGEDVLIGGEGDVFKNRYKIVRIGLTQIVIEDMQFSSEQELSLEAPRG